MNPPFTFRDEDLNNLELVRQIILYRLKHDESWNWLYEPWNSNNQDFVRFEPERLKSRFFVLVGEVMWQLIAQGVITPGTNSANPGLPGFRVTDYGSDVLEKERFIPHDPAGYLDELRGLADKVVDDTATAYVEESLRCFTTGCNMASVLLMGVASECVFLNLCQVVRDSLKCQTEQAKFDKLHQVKPRHRWLVEKYENLDKKVRRNQLPESLDMTLKSLYDMIRRQRNELGHPQENPPEITRERAFMFFKLLPQLVADVEAFASYCQATGL